MIMQTQKNSLASLGISCNMTGLDCRNTTSGSPCGAFNVLSNLRKITHLATLEAKSRAIDEIVKVEELATVLSRKCPDRWPSGRLCDTRAQTIIRTPHTQRRGLEKDISSNMVGVMVPYDGLGDFRQVYKSPAFVIKDQSTRRKRPNLQSSSRRISYLERFMIM
jgi:hypothetical protein